MFACTFLLDKKCVTKFKIYILDAKIYIYIYMYLYMYLFDFTFKFVIAKSYLKNMSYLLF